jgi:nucleoside-diphosphate-sugar epimerase
VGEVFNLGAGREIGILDLTQWINELTENPGGIIYRERRNWDKNSRLLSSIEKAKKVLGYNPRTDFKEGLGHTHNWFTENLDNIKQSTEF